ncbi:hypothetical protein ACFQ4B_36010, partial [Paenibacillus vulneris]
DETVAEAVCFELLDLNPALYPSLCKTTKRIMRRFSSCELGTFKKDESDASPEEIAVVDEAVDALDQARSISGLLRHYADILLNPIKIIR